MLVQGSRGTGFLNNLAEDPLSKEIGRRTAKRR
jgi:hypothetical protein